MTNMATHESIDTEMPEYTKKKNSKIVVTIVRVVFTSPVHACLVRANAKRVQHDNDNQREGHSVDKAGNCALQEVTKEIL